MWDGGKASGLRCPMPGVGLPSPRQMYHRAPAPLGSRRPVSLAILHLLEERELALRRCLYTEMKAIPFTASICPLATYPDQGPVVSNEFHKESRREKMQRHDIPTSVLPDWINVSRNAKELFSLMAGAPLVSGTVLSEMRRKASTYAFPYLKELRDWTGGVGRVGGQQRQGCE